MRVRAGAGRTDVWMWGVAQMGKSLAGGQNALLDYLKSLDASAIQELTACNDDVLEAINSFIQRMLGAACLPLSL